MVSLIPKKKIDQLPLAEIKWGTNNFDEENLIGYGGFGHVYKGKLAEYRGYGPVAVKRQRDDSRQGRFEFNTEISILSVYQHPNIVSLIGYCEEAEELILVYEYAVNHSLDRCLKPYTEETDILTWERRLKICIDVASALECLHEGIGYHNVIHRDLKSGNILLDENWDAKVTDLGLSKESHVNQTITYVISGSAGTHVYIDPDYKESKILRIESDIYSFGVVLFELLCGRMAFIREYTEEERSLPEVARRCFKEGRIEEIVDPSIIKQIRWSSLSTFSAIAHRCIETKHERRPKISEVIADLKNALKFQERRTIIPLVPNQQEDCRIFDKVLGKQEDAALEKAPKKSEKSHKGDQLIIPSPTNICSNSYINAAFRSSITNEAYLFMKKEYVRINYAPHSKGDKILNGPLPICDGFPSLADTPFGEYGIDCAFRSSWSDEAFIFAGNLCAIIAYAPGTILKGPLTIVGMFPFMKGTVFEDGVDSAFDSSIAEEAYLFKGDQYVRINYADNRLIHHNFIKTGFPSLKDTIFATRIDAAFTSHRSNEAYLFKGNQYALINFAPGTSDDYIIGGVSPILPNWPSLKGILPRKNKGLDIHFPLRS